MTSVHPPFQRDRAKDVWEIYIPGGTVHDEEYDLPFYHADVRSTEDKAPQEFLYWCASYNGDSNDAGTIKLGYRFNDKTK